MGGLLAEGAPAGRPGRHGAAIPAEEAEHCRLLPDRRRHRRRLSDLRGADDPPGPEAACPYWGYFCQISDSTTSYGSYSGAIPTEKITWGKLDVGTPSFVIESDATIVAPLIFAYVLDW